MRFETDRQNRFNLLRIIHASILLFLLLCCFSVTADAASQVTRKVFLSQLLDARNLDLSAFDVKDKSAFILKSGLVTESVAKLDAPVSRREALRWGVQALGLETEARIVSRSAPFLRSAIPFRDTGGLSEFERGCLAVALTMQPPLLKVKGGAFEPDRKLSSSEVEVFLSAVGAASQGLSLQISFSPISGMKLDIDRSGVSSGIPKWRVLVDGFGGKNEALELKAYFKSKGFNMTELQPNYEWYLRCDLLDDYYKVRQLKSLAEKKGKTVRILPSVTNANLDILPSYKALLTVAPSKFKLLPIIPPNGITTLDTLSSMARSGKVRAAINAGFFYVTSMNRGMPIGVLRDNGLLLTKPYNGRTCMGWNVKNQASFGYVSWDGTVQLDEGWLQINSVNHYVKGNTLILYTAQYGKPTPADASVIEVTVKGGVCASVTGGGASEIEKGTWVLAGYGTNASLLAGSLSPGKKVKVESSFIGSDNTSWDGLSNIIQAGPFLVNDGEIDLRDEGFDRSLVNLRHPRTAVGLTDNGEWFFLVIDGRNGLHSVGATLSETAEYLKGKGVSYALNLDGGGSTELLIDGAVYNFPSDGKERPISYGLGFR